MKKSLKKACLQRLHDTFGMPGYRPGQYEAVRALLSCRDVMCILPTGAGKSLCWQLPAVVHPGLTVVVSPLIALMRDQVEHLHAMGIPAVTLDSLMAKEEREDAFAKLHRGTARIVFVSPERLLNERFRQLCSRIPPWMVVVDEAHCVVQWGEGFRPAYAEIGTFIRQLPKRPVICALTATADREVQRAIRESLRMRRVKRVLLPVIRENLCYEVRTTLDSTGDILRLLHEQPCRTVVFCRTRLRTERLSVLMQQSGLSVSFYHAGINREERMSIQHRFATGELQILCATTAFGMGIDIPDIRRIIHDELPDSIIDYVQQSGRAGRDGKKAECILYVEPNHLAHRADIWKKLGRTMSRHPIRRWMTAREKSRALKKLLQVTLASECIVRGISNAFGQKAAACGKCSACRRGGFLKQVPDIGALKEKQVRLFLLKWQRDALAKASGCPPEQIVPDNALQTAAKTYMLPAETSAPQELERLLKHFLQNGHA